MDKDVRSVSRCRCNRVQQWHKTFVMNAIGGYCDMHQRVGWWNNGWRRQFDWWFGCRMGFDGRCQHVCALGKAVRGLPLCRRGNSVDFSRCSRLLPTLAEQEQHCQQQTGGGGGRR